LTQHPLDLSEKESIDEKSYSSVDLNYISYIHWGMKQNLKVNGLDEDTQNLKCVKLTMLAEKHNV